MRPFEEVFAEAVDVEEVDPRVVERLRALYEAAAGGGARSAAIAPPLVALLEFLATPEGRTDANCRAVDYFFCLGDWSWGQLPEPWESIFADLGGGLHETVSAPDIAEALQATPEQLLERIRAAAPRSHR